MKTKQKMAVYGLTTTALLVGIVIVANVVSMNLFGRADLTSGKIYSLNDASKKIVAGLEDDLLVKAYFSKNLPPPYNSNARYVQDQLQEYRAYSKGHLKFTFVDPGDDAKLEEECQKYRIPPVQVQVIEQDQYQAKKVYMGLVCLYKDRQEVLPVVDNPVGLEYDITSAVKRLTSGKQDLPSIGILSGHGEPGMEQLQTVSQVFSKLYRMENVSLAGGKKVPENIQALLIASPRSDIAAWDRYAIDQYIMKGGKVAFLVDKVDVNLQYGQATPVRLTIDDWTRAYGFKIGDNLVADHDNAGAVTVTQQEGQFRMMTQVPFPFIPQLRDFNRTNVMVKGLQRFSPYFASTVDTSDAKAKGLRAEALILTSPKTLLQERTFDINPVQKWQIEQFDKGQQIVAAIISGKFTSAFKGQPVPAAGDSGAVVMAGSDADRHDQSPDSRILVIGDGEFFVDQKGGGDQANLLFFQNMVDWLAQDEALIAIRSHGAAERPLRQVTPPTKRLVKYANMLGAPLVVVLLGLGMRQMRRRRKFDL